MSNEYFNLAAPVIHSQLSEGESIEDIRILYSTIVKARRLQRNLGEADERIALFSLCFFGLPGKAASYRREVVNFRRTFAGVSKSATLRIRFRACLKKRLLLAATIEELVPLNELGDLFAAAEDDKGTGARRLGLPPLEGPDLTSDLDPSMMARSQSAGTEMYTV